MVAELEDRNLGPSVLASHGGNGRSNGAAQSLQSAAAVTDRGLAIGRRRHGELPDRHRQLG